MNNTAFKLGAVGCSFAYLLTFLLLPYLGVTILGLFSAPGMDCLQINVLCYLPLIAGIAMIICSFVLPGKKAAIVNAIGAFIPLIVFSPIRSSYLNGGASLMDLIIPGISSFLSGVAGKAAERFITFGVGGVLSILFGIGAAVLCFLSDNVQQTKRTPGPSPSPDEDW